LLRGHPPNLFCGSDVLSLYCVMCVTSCLCLCYCCCWWRLDCIASCVLRHVCDDIFVTGVDGDVLSLYCLNVCYVMSVMASLLLRARSCMDRAKICDARQGSVCIFVCMYVCLYACISWFASRYTSCFLFTHRHSFINLRNCVGQVSCRHLDPLKCYTQMTRSTCMTSLEQLIYYWFSLSIGIRVFLCVPLPTRLQNVGLGAEWKKKTQFDRMAFLGENK
jgi:hypothetical protein